MAAHLTDLTRDREHPFWPRARPFLNSRFNTFPIALRGSAYRQRSALSRPPYVEQAQVTRAPSRRLVIQGTRLISHAARSRKPARQKFDSYVGAVRNGFNTGTPNALKSATLRVTTVS